MVAWGMLDGRANEPLVWVESSGLLSSSASIITAASPANSNPPALIDPRRIAVVMPHTRSEVALGQHLTVRYLDTSPRNDWRGSRHAGWMPTGGERIFFLQAKPILEEHLCPLLLPCYALSRSRGGRCGRANPMPEADGAMALCSGFWLLALAGRQREGT